MILRETWESTRQAGVGVSAGGVFGDRLSEVECPMFLLGVTSFESVDSRLF